MFLRLRSPAGPLGSTRVYKSFFGTIATPFRTYFIRLQFCFYDSVLLVVEGVLIF